MLGVATYGVREGAKRKNNRAELQTFVNEIFTINLGSTILAYAALAVTILLTAKLHDYALLIAVQSISILLTTLGVDWINTIYEDFFLITVRSIAIHIITMLLLFLFVKQASDYYIYAFFTVIGNGIVCISNWFYIRRYVKPRLTLRPNLKKHLKPLLIMVSNSIATSIYVNFDTTMLGWIKGDAEVGLYTVAVKVYTIVKGVMSAVYAVTIPRLASYLGEHRDQDYKKLNTVLWGYLTTLLIPSGVGLICVSDEVMQFMGGAEYASASLSLQILSGALIFAIYGGLVTAVLNITIGREKDNLIATTISAVMNCGLNFFAIPMWGQYGAAFTTLLSEAFVMFFCIFRNKNIKDYLDFKTVWKNVLQAGIGSFFIICVSVLIKTVVSSWLLRLGLIMILSVVVYGGFMYLVKNSACLYLIEKIGRLVSRRKP